jgi:hypothetical protein
LPSPSAAPTSVELPAGYDRIPWAHVDPIANLVTFGVVGKQATGSRPFDPNQRNVRAVGSVLFIEGQDGVEILDPATGATVARFDPSAMVFPVADDDLLRAYAPHDVAYDIGRGYIYRLDANAEGLQLRRFHLDGSHPTTLARVAPDPHEEFWEGGMAIDPSGTVDVVICPPTDTRDPDHRCRLYQAKPGAAATGAPRYLPLSAPRFCFAIAASDHYLFGSSYAGCRADGGYPSEIPYVALDLRTFKSVVLNAASNFEVLVAAEDTDLGPQLIGNVRPTGWLGPVAYPRVAEDLSLTEFNIVPMSQLMTDQRQGWAWSLLGAGRDWQVRQSYGPDFGACYLADPSGTCPVGPVVMVAPGVDGITLPPGTYGEIMPGLPRD